MPTRETDVSPCSTSTSSDADAQAVGHDLGPRGLVALAVRRRAGPHDDLAVGAALDLGAVPAARDVSQGAQDVRRRQPAHLDVAGQPDPELLRVAGVAAGLLLLAQLLVVGQLERPVEGRLVVPRVDAQAHDRRGGLLERRVQVHAPNLGRVLADPPGERVDQPLDHERGLGPPGAAIGVGGRRVRHHAGELVPVGLDVVRAHVDPAAQLGDAGREQLEVSAHVGELDELHAEDLAVLGAGEGAVVQHAAAVDRGHVVLLRGSRSTSRAARACVPSASASASSA